MKGMQILVQAKVPISRPDDFFAEMLKDDTHMAKVKSKLLKQQHKIQKFEEKKSKQENKKFHKAIKLFTQQKRHTEKRENMAAIDVLKDRIKAGNGDVEEKEFNKIMLSHGSKMGIDAVKGEKSQSRTKVMDKIKTPIPQAKKGEPGRVGTGRFNK
jgi:rRNA-processing protein EBP2